MNIQRILLKIAYWLVALSIVVLIGFTFYARHIISQQSQGTQNSFVKNAEEEEGTNIKFSGMSLTIDDEKAKKEVEEVKEAIKKDEGTQTDQTDQNN